MSPPGIIDPTDSDRGHEGHGPRRLAETRTRLMFDASTWRLGGMAPGRTTYADQRT